MTDPGRALGVALQQLANIRGRYLCGATDGDFGRCNLPAGHQTGGWHLEMRKGEVWANWRGPMPGEWCGICGLDGRHHGPRARPVADRLGLGSVRGKHRYPGFPEPSGSPGFGLPDGGVLTLTLTCSASFAGLEGKAPGREKFPGKFPGTFKETFRLFSNAESRCLLVT